MSGERPSHIPPENPFSSQEGKLPPEPTEQFVARYLGKRRGEAGASTSGVPEPSDLATPEEHAAYQETLRTEHGRRLVAKLFATETAKLTEFFGLEEDRLEPPPLPPDVTPERIEQWREQGFALHYLPRVEIVGTEPGLKTPLKFNNIDKGKVDRFGPDQLKPLELPGAWVLIDARPKPVYFDGTQQYPNDTEIARTLGGSRFRTSWSQLHEPATLARLAAILQVDPSNIRLPRMVEYNVLGNLHHPEWGSTNTYEWYEDSYDQGRERLSGGDSDLGGLARVDRYSPGYAAGDIGFRPLVSFPSS